MFKKLIHWLSRARAWFSACAGGYFWLPCPRCGKCFGGNEKPGGSIYIGDGIWQSCCPNCPEHTMTPRGAAHYEEMVGRQQLLIERGEYPMTGAQGVRFYGGGEHK